MIGYVTLGTNDIQRAAKFYDALIGELGAKRFMETEGFIAWATGPGAPAVSVIKPYDGKPATVGNGVMVAKYSGLVCNSVVSRSSKRTMNKMVAAPTPPTTR